MSLAIGTLRELGRYLGVGYVLYIDGETCELRDCPEPRGKGNRPRILVERDLCAHLLAQNVIGALQSCRSPKHGNYKIGWMDIGLPRPKDDGYYYLFVQ